MIQTTYELIGKKGKAFQESPIEMFQIMFVPLQTLKKAAWKEI